MRVKEPSTLMLP